MKIEMMGNWLGSGRCLGRTLEVISKMGRDQRCPCVKLGVVGKVGG